MRPQGKRRDFCQLRRLGESEGGLCLHRDGAESGGIVNGQIREHLAIDLELCFQQPVDQTAVGQAVQACGCVDTRNPQRAELALFLAAVAIGVLARLDDCLLGGPIDLAAGVVIALRPCQEPSCDGGRPSLHVLLVPFNRPLFVMRQQLGYTPDITFVDEAGAAGTRVAFDLAVLVAEVMAAIGRVTA